MPIPAIDPIHHILPPYLIEPTINSNMSPYPTTMQHIAERFAQTTARAAIFRGLIEFRQLLRSENVEAFQYIAGSFVEEIEALESRDTKDVDVVTFIHAPEPDFVSALAAKHPKLASHGILKREYYVDHRFIDLGVNGAIIADHTRFWTLLFSHRRAVASDDYGKWKGILRVGLSRDEADDKSALLLLGAGGTT